LTFLTVSPNEEDQRKQNNVIRGVMDGKTNNTGAFTVTPNAATTVISDLRIGAGSVINVSPITAAAATEWASGSMYISSVGKQTFTVTHTNSATTGRDFTYAAQG
tara:strand:- start:2502 stop:2816 length:315 start_codon:yes stop_codon:yes gene_type:complete